MIVEEDENNYLTDTMMSGTNWKEEAGLDVGEISDEDDSIGILGY